MGCSIKSLGTYVSDNMLGVHKNSSQRVCINSVNILKQYGISETLFEYELNLFGPSILNSKLVYYTIKSLKFSYLKLGTWYYGLCW